MAIENPINDNIIIKTENDLSSERFTIAAEKNICFIIYLKYITSSTYY